MANLECKPEPGWCFEKWKGLPEKPDEIHPRMADTPAKPFTLTLKTEGMAKTIVHLAVATPPGWRFDHWEGDLPLGTSPTQPELSLAPEADCNIKAICRREKWHQVPAPHYVFDPSRFWF
jgi:hypothetical protein